MSHTLFQYLKSILSTIRNHFKSNRTDPEALDKVVFECQEQRNELRQQLLENDLAAMQQLAYGRMFNAFLEIELSAYRVIQSEKRLCQNLIIAFLSLLGGEFILSFLKHFSLL